MIGMIKTKLWRLVNVTFEFVTFYFAAFEWLQMEVLLQIA